MNITYHTYTSMTIRVVRELTDNLLATVERNEWRLLLGSVSQATTHYAIASQKMQKLGGVIVIAKDNDRVVGSMYALFPAGLAYKYKTRFHKLLVNPEYRGKGIARKLFEMLESEVKMRGKTTIWFYYHKDNPAVTLYLKIGYQHAPMRSKTPTFIKLEKKRL